MAVRVCRRNRDCRLMTPAELAEIRTAVAKLCADFPGEYWRELDREREYPTEFVRRSPRRATSPA